jgi:hypothetical protein
VEPRIDASSQAAVTLRAAAIGKLGREERVSMILNTGRTGIRPAAGPESAEAAGAVHPNALAQQKAVEDLCSLAGQARKDGLPSSARKFLDFVISHKFDLKALSGREVARLFIHGLNADLLRAMGQMQMLDPADHASAAVKAITAIQAEFESRFSAASGPAAFQRLASEMVSSELSLAEKRTLAEAIGRMPIEKVAELFLEIQRLPNAPLNDPHNPVSAKLKLELSRMGPELFHLMTGRFQGLTAAGRLFFRQALNRSAQENLAKTILRGVVDAAEAGDPGAVSAGIERLKALDTALRSYAAAPDNLLGLEDCMAQALRNESLAMRLRPVLLGAARIDGKLVAGAHRNDVFVALTGSTRWAVRGRKEKILVQQNLQLLDRASKVDSRRSAYAAT